MCAPHERQSVTAIAKNHGNNNREFCFPLLLTSVMQFAVNRNNQSQFELKSGFKCTWWTRWILSIAGGEKVSITYQFAVQESTIESTIFQAQSSCVSYEDQLGF